jgi:hypothetical protein
MIAGGRFERRESRRAGEADWMTGTHVSGVRRSLRVVKMFSCCAAGRVPALPVPGSELRRFCTSADVASSIDVAEVTAALLGCLSIDS